MTLLWLLPLKVLHTVNVRAGLKVQISLLVHASRSIRSLADVPPHISNFQMRRKRNDRASADAATHRIKTV